jgi:hypothetical protein
VVDSIVICSRMKIFFKILQYTFKFLASIFSKLGAQYTYTKLYKYLMRYKLYSIIYKPLKFIFNNIIYLIKLSSAIIAILSLFNISLFYYNFDAIDSINDLINEVINYIKALYKKWISDDEDEEITEPIDFFHYRKDIKVIEKSIQQSSNSSYWILPLMIIGGTVLYFYNPHINLEEIINPAISKIEAKLPENFPITFVTGTFIYKFITISITYITGYKLTDDDDNSDRPQFNATYREDLNYLRSFKPKEVNKTYSPTDELSNEEKDEIAAYFSKEEEDTPKASASNLPNCPPYIENPFKKIKIIPYSQNSSEIRIEDWE